MYNFELEGSPLLCDLWRQTSPLQQPTFSKSNIFKLFLETTSVLVSCYPHYELIFKVRNYPSIYNFELEGSPLLCDIWRQTSPLQHFPSQTFSNFFWKLLQFLFHATLIMSWFSKSATTLRYTILDSRVPLCYAILEVGALSLKVRISIENNWGWKVNNFQTFSGNYFSSCFMLPWS